MEKKEAAYILYREGLTQDAIASMLGVSRRSVGLWKKRHDWEDRRRRETLRENNTTDMVWNLYQHNLEVLSKRVEKWKEEGLDEMVSNADVAALQKFYAQVKDRSIMWHTYVRVMRELKAHIASHDMALAKKLEDSHLLDDFLNLKRSEV